ncbi:glycosyltransferase family 32 protein [Sphingobacterium tabacisoli]|uniref:Glycosyltransferase family 32 protein n=1 Tax=Sphingobacterium tabacisoli TaxID=2044855 RepID=A0ABW5KZQ1_9SPHI|nr:glycosyltransferase [Sphingobacterium tabacisoli]
MIPKTIHYCWFGGNELPKLAEKCIESWKTFLPEYEVKQWNESNFDLDFCQYTREAYDNKKYAYVTDVVRLYALKSEGGVYLDSDVEVLKPLDDFLHHAAFSGFESNNLIPTGIMASIKDGEWVSDMLSYYNDKSFLDSSNNPILETNVTIITKLMEQKGIILNNTYQEISNYIAFYPHDYFCPKEWTNGVITLTDNSHCIHHFAGSWLPKGYKRKRAIYNFIKRLIGIDRYKRLRGYE